MKIKKPSNKEDFYELKSSVFDLEEEWLTIKNEIANNSCSSQKFRKTLSLKLMTEYISKVSTFEDFLAMQVKILQESIYLNHHRLRFYHPQVATKSWKTISECLLAKMIELINSGVINLYDSQHRINCINLCNHLLANFDKKDKSFESLSIISLVIKSLDDSHFLAVWNAYQNNKLSKSHCSLVLPNLHLIDEHCYDDPHIFLHYLLAVIGNQKLAIAQDLEMARMRYYFYFPISMGIHHCKTKENLQILMHGLQKFEFNFLGQQQKSLEWLCLCVVAKAHLLTLDPDYSIKNFENDFLVTEQQEEKIVNVKSLKQSL